MSDDDRSVPPPTTLAAESKVPGALAESTASTSHTQDVIRQLPPIAEAAVADRRYALRGATESTSSRWGALELRQKIADGGFGTVYRAWDPALEREVALKVLRAADRSGSRHPGRSPARPRAASERRHRLRRRRVRGNRRLVDGIRRRSDAHAGSGRAGVARRRRKRRSSGSMSVAPSRPCTRRASSIAISKRTTSCAKPAAASS